MTGTDVSTATATLPFHSIGELSVLIATRQISPVDVVTTLLSRIERLNSTLASYITVCAAEAVAAARAAERDIIHGKYRGPLHGIPIAYKDIIWTKGVRTTAHSRALADFVPAEDATHVHRLSAAGMILIGKTNTGEFACGTSELFGNPRNPWSLNHYTGGSSNGSANAVAAGLAVAATGTDTGGSVRVPASFCGVVGLKPTFGRVSRHGIIPLSWTMDHVGTLTRTVDDAALMLTAMSGYDPLDPSSATVPVPDFRAGLERGIRGLTVGIPREHYFDGLHPDVERAVHAALDVLRAEGVQVVPVHLPRAGDLAAAAPLMYRAEAYVLHAERLRRRAADYGRRARQKICSGAFFTAAEYHQAAQLRRLWCDELRSVLQHVDAIVTPTVPYPAFTLQLQEAGPPDTSWGTRQFNMSGHPAITVPCGFSGEHLPIGLQIAGRTFDELTILRLAHVYQKLTDWHTRRPRLDESLKDVTHD